MLTLEPGDAEPGHRPSAGQHVEGGDDLAQGGDVAIGDAGAQRTEARRAGEPGEVAERRVRLEHLLPLAADLGDLHVVVHHPDRVEAGLLGRCGDVGEPLAELGRTARPRETGQLQSEGQRHRVLLLTVGGMRCGDELRWHEDDPVVADRHHRIEALALDRRAGGSEAAQLRGDDRCGDAVSTLAVAAAHLSLGQVEHRRDDRNTPTASRVDIDLAARRLERGRVDDRRQPPSQPVVDDEVEHLEGGSPGALVALARADHRPQSIGRDHLLRTEPPRRPRRFAAAGRTDEQRRGTVREGG